MTAIRLFVNKITALIVTLLGWVSLLSFGVVFGLTMAFFFAPFVILLTTLLFSIAVVRYIFTRRFVVQDGVEGVVAALAMGSVLAFPALLAVRLGTWSHKCAAARFSELPEVRDETLFIWIAAGVIGVLTMLLCFVLAIRKSRKLPKKAVVGSQEAGSRTPLAAAHVLFSAILLMLFVAGPAGSVMTVVYKRSYSPGWKACVHHENAKALYEKSNGAERGWPSVHCPRHYRKQGNETVTTCGVIPQLPALLRFYAWLACWPALLLGFGAIRRGLWMLSVGRMVENVATSTVRGAAMGLVELRGRALPAVPGNGDDILACRVQPLSGVRTKVGPFFLEDETGRVLVDVPADCIPGDDQRIVLTRHTRLEGDEQVHSLIANDEVYVIGELASEGRSGKTMDVVRPWSLPYGQFMLGFTNALFNRPWDLVGIIDLNRALGFGFLPHIFLVCDGDEKAAKGAMFHAWKRQMAVGGAILLAGAGCLFFMVRML